MVLVRLRWLAARCLHIIVRVRLVSGVVGRQERGCSTLSVVLGSVSVIHNHTIMSSENTEKLKQVLARELAEMQASGELDDLTAAEEREQLAESAFTVRDLRKFEESDAKTPSAYLLDEYGISADSYDDSEELHAAVSAKRAQRAAGRPASGLRRQLMAAAETLEPDDEELGDGELVALDAEGRSAVVREHAVFELMPGEREPLAARRKSLSRSYGALMRSAEPLSPGELRVHFVGTAQHIPDRGWYGRRMAREWWSEVGRSNLLRLPGVEPAGGDGDGEGLVFTGIEVSEVELSESHMTPLEAYRSDPRVEALDYCARAHGEGTELYDRVMRLWDSVARAGSTTTEELARDHRLYPEELSEELAECPHIERSEETFDPGEVSLSDVETLAELYELEQAKTEETVRWEFTGVSEGSEGSA